MEIVDYFMERIRPIDVAVAFVVAVVAIAAFRVARRAWRKEKEKK